MDKITSELFSTWVDAVVPASENFVENFDD